MDLFNHSMGITINKPDATQGAHQKLIAIGRVAGGLTALESHDVVAFEHLVEVVKVELYVIAVDYHQLKNQGVQQQFVRKYLQLLRP